MVQGSMNGDRIEKKVLLRAPRARVWQAISDAREFGTWFGVDFAGPFVQGGRLAGKIVPTRVDPEVAAMQEPYAGTAFEIVVERIEPEQRLAFRWHPYAVEPGVDYAKEPTTLVTFDLADVAEGTLLTITESGYDRLPQPRRAEAYQSNEGGWEMQTRLIARYLASQPPAGAR